MELGFVIITLFQRIYFLDSLFQFRLNESAARKADL